MSVRSICRSSTFGSELALGLCVVAGQPQQPQTPQQQPQPGTNPSANPEDPEAAVQQQQEGSRAGSQAGSQSGPGGEQVPGGDGGKDGTPPGVPDPKDQVPVAMVSYDHSYKVRRGLSAPPGLGF
jgi:hypothetical protein